MWTACVPLGMPPGLLLDLLLDLPPSLPTHMRSPAHFSHYPPGFRRLEL